MGRSSLIMVIGFSVVLLMIGGNISKVSTSAMENYMGYYKSQVAHSLAGSCINLAGRALYENALWTGGFSNKSFGGGVLNCKVENIGGQQLRLTATATFMDQTRQISCVVQPSSFSRYAYYTTTDMSGYWVTGDTCWGPLHVNNWLNVAGTPVFMGRATTLNGLHRYTNPQNISNTLDKPKFKGGFDSGINVILPTSFDVLKGAAGTGGRKITGGQDVYVELMNSGHIKWKRDNNWGGGGWNNDPLADFTGNGAFYAEGVNVHIKGTLKGRLTVGCGGVTGSNTEGNIWLDDDIDYHKDPRIHPSSTDMLGLVAENKLWIADNTNNRGPGNDYILMGCVFSRTDGLWVENYNGGNYNGGAVRGRLTTVGSQVANVGGYTGIFSGDPPIIIHGYAPGGAFYDQRLMVSSPPFFPTTGQYEIVSWLE